MIANVLTLPPPINANADCLELKKNCVVLLINFYCPSLIKSFTSQIVCMSLCYCLFRLIYDWIHIIYDAFFCCCCSNIKWQKKYVQKGCFMVLFIVRFMKLLIIIFFSSVFLFGCFIYVATHNDFMIQCRK